MDFNLISVTYEIMFDLLLIYAVSQTKRILRF